MTVPRWMKSLQPAPLLNLIVPGAEAVEESRPELARRAGVPPSTLRNWEDDRGFPGLPVLVRLAEVLGVPVERFAEGVDEPEAAAEASRRTRKGKTP
jgi:transcriptional regulator with XRE-family HTH domain